MLSVDWYVRNRIKHVHPVSDGNSRCRLGAARHSTTSRVLPAQSASRVTVRHGMNVPDSLYLHNGFPLLIRRHVHIAMGPWLYIILLWLTLTYWYVSVSCIWICQQEWNRFPLKVKEDVTMTNGYHLKNDTWYPVSKVSCAWKNLLSRVGGHNMLTIIQTGYMRWSLTYCHPITHACIGKLRLIHYKDTILPVFEIPFIVEINFTTVLSP